MWVVYPAVSSHACQASSAPRTASTAAWLPLTLTDVCGRRTSTPRETDICRTLLMTCASLSSLDAQVSSVLAINTASDDEQSTLQYYTCISLHTYSSAYCNRGSFAEAAEPLASCLINAQPLPAHCRAADDNSFIGCIRPRPERWLVAAQCPFRWKLVPISVLVWVRSFIEPDVLKTNWMYRSTTPFRFIWQICSGN